jgi:hypothetical protein
MAMNSAYPVKVAALAIPVVYAAVTGYPQVIAGQKYAQYIDAETKVVRAPHGFATGDDAWRSSWFYASLLLIHAKDVDLYNQLQRDHGLDVGDVKKYLTYFRDKCTGGDAWKRATTLEATFSRDQLSPLLYLLCCIKQLRMSDCEPLAKDILNDLVRLVKQRGAVSNTAAGAVDGNMRYVIDVVCRKYGIEYLTGNVRALYKRHFGLALKAHSLIVQLPVEELATMDDYSVFNALGLVTLQCLAWGKDDENVKKWRANYRQHADKGWGPAFRITSGRSQSTDEVKAYAHAFIIREDDNDIVMAQRPVKYLQEKFPQAQLRRNGVSGEWLVLDYIILRGLELAWK